ncbi:hypothetical protein [Glycomyces tarimensis]
MTNGVQHLPEQLLQDIVERDDFSCVPCGNALWGPVDERWTLHRRIPENPVADPADARDLWGPANLISACILCADLLDSTAPEIRRTARARGLVVWRSEDPTFVPVYVATGINQPKAALTGTVAARAWLLDGHGRRRPAPGPAPAGPVFSGRRPA